MSSINLSLPESLYKALRELAEKENISVDQFITLAAAEKVSALMMEDYLAERAKRADKAKFQAVLDKVPDVEPEPYDK